MGLYVIGDIHGQYAKLIRLLQGSHLVDDSLSWIGGQSSLWCLGDFFDRGPSGLDVVILWMRLQKQAVKAGGYVGALLGNHDVTLLSAHFLGEQRTTGASGTFIADWYRNGGVTTDLKAIERDQIDWLIALPAMALVEDRLFVHADAMFYTQYGSSIGEVNEAFRALLYSRDIVAWDKLLDQFSEHRAFYTQGGTDRARSFMERYGGSQIVHGHTPIPKMSKHSAYSVRDAYLYANGLCMNVDGGMYLGGPGFIHHFKDPEKTSGEAAKPE